MSGTDKTTTIVIKKTGGKYSLIINSLWIATKDTIEEVYQIIRNYVI